MGNLQAVANRIIPQIMGAPDKQAVFNQVLNGISGAQDAYKKVLDCGGDPRQAVMNQLTAQGQQAMGQQIESYIGNLINQFK